jgi:phosphocarrier protein
LQIADCSDAPAIYNLQWIELGAAMKEVTLTITNQVGLHARPAAAFYKKSREFKSKIMIQNLSRPESKEVPVSPFYLLQLGVGQGHDVRLRADGEDEQAAIAALTQLVEENFGET